MRRKMFSVVAGLLFAGAALGFSEAAASDHVNSEALITTSAVPVAEGVVDVEFGVTRSKADAGKRTMFANNWSRDRRGLPGENNSYRLYEWTLSATMGVAPDTDVSLSTGFVDMYDRAIRRATGGDLGAHGRGMDDLTVAVRRRLVDEDNLSVAYIPGLTIPTGRHSNLSRERFGPGQNYWTLDQRVAATHEIDEIDVVVNADIGYSLPFGRTRRTMLRDFGTYSLGDKDVSERGVLDANIAAVYAEGPVRPLVELNYAHRWVSRGNDSDIIHATLGGIVSVDDQMRVKVGYQHPVAGRNAARTRKLLLSMAYMF